MTTREILSNPSAKLSEILRAALADVRHALELGTYSLDGRSWHKPTDASCQICLAGGALAGMHNFDDSLDLGVCDGDSELIRERLDMLDWIRSGYRVSRVHTAVLPQTQRIHQAASCSANEMAPLEMYDELADALEKEGL